MISEMGDQHELYRETIVHKIRNQCGKEHMVTIDEELEAAQDAKGGDRHAIHNSNAQWGNDRNSTRSHPRCDANDNLFKRGASQ